MSKTDGNVTEFVLHAHNVAALSAPAPCWICQASLNTKAAFCHDCGTVQPVRGNLDHFARLGLERRYDIDQNQLADRYQALSRIFQNERLMAKGPRQKQLTIEHYKAVEDAHTVLRDPVSRAEYLLALAQEPVSAAETHESVLELQTELQTAADGAAIDRVAFKAGHGVEIVLRELSAAFRQQSYTEAASLVARLSQLEEITLSARQRRGNAA